MFPCFRMAFLLAGRSRTSHLLSHTAVVMQEPSEGHCLAGLWAWLPLGFGMAIFSPRKEAQGRAEMYFALFLPSAQELADKLQEGRLSTRGQR